MPWVILIGKLHWLLSLVEDFMRLFGQGCWKKVCAHSIKWRQFSGFVCNQINIIILWRELSWILYVTRQTQMSFLEVCTYIPRSFWTRLDKKENISCILRSESSDPFQDLQSCTQFENELRLYAFQKSDLNGHIRSTWASWNSFNFHPCWACRCTRRPPWNKYLLHFDWESKRKAPERGKRGAY